MPFTQSDIDTLTQAIVDRKGARTVQFSDQSITFESIDEMLKLLAVMRQDVAAAAGQSRTRYASTRKGTTGPTADSWRYRFNGDCL